MRPGRTGNEVLADTLAAMKAAGIDGTVYTHPIGDHGHGAGPLIGLWDRQAMWFCPAWVRLVLLGGPRGR